MALTIPFLLLGALLFGLILVYSVFFKTELVMPSIIMIFISLGSALVINIIDPPPNVSDEDRIIEQTGQAETKYIEGDSEVSTEDDSKVTEVEDMLIISPAD